METATYGLEFVAARIPVDQIVDLRYTRCSNQKQKLHVWRQLICHHKLHHSHSLLDKRHPSSAYHRVREAIASKYLMFIWKDGKTNPADILSYSKHWEFSQIWPLLKPLLFWRGETAENKQQPQGSDKPPTDCPSSEPQGNQKDSRLATASSQ